MVELTAKSPFEGLLPVEAGGVELLGIDIEGITAVIAGRDSDREAFKKATGVAFPAPGKSTGKEGGRAIWTGPDQCFWLGKPVRAIKGHALSDQSDGWVVMRLKGAGAEDVLARLVAIDLRVSVFKRGHTARTLLGHMACSITRSGAEAFDIMVFRSMTKTAVHELSDAITKVAARQKA